MSERSALSPAIRLVIRLLAVGLLASACASDSSQPAALSPATSPVSPDTSAGSNAAVATVAPPSAETAVTDEAFPVAIDHKFGSTQIPARPERVVALGYTEQDSIVAFGIEPIAARYAFGPEDDVFFPWADQAAGGAAPVILPRSEINFEQIAALEPDLIMAVTAGLDEAQYETLTAIAPTVVQPAEYVDFGTPWQVHTLIAGRALGQEGRAMELIAEVEAMFDGARAAHPEFVGLSLALSGPSFEGTYPFHASDDTRTRFFGDLGFVVPGELDAIAGDAFYGTLSKEQADLLDTDVLVWQSGSAAERSEIEADPILAALPVAAQGRALFIEGTDYDAIQFSSALSLPYLLESFIPKLAAVVR